MGIWLGTARLGAEWAWRHVRDSAWPNAGSGGTSRPLHACLLRVRPLCGSAGKTFRALAIFLSCQPTFRFPPPMDHNSTFTDSCADADDRHPSTLSSTLNLCKLLRAKGDLGAAEPAAVTCVRE